MAEPTPPPVAPSAAGTRPRRESGIPRWVIVGGIIAAVVVVAIVIVHLAGGGLGGHFPMVGH